MLFEVGPRQTRVIEKIDEEQESRLNVIATSGVVALALAHWGKEEVSTESPKRNFLDVLATLALIARGKAEVDQVETIWVVVAHYDIRKFDIIVDEAHPV